MKRNEFIKQCGRACLGAMGMAAVLPGCIPAQSLTTPIINNQLVVPLSSFTQKSSKGEKMIRRYMVVGNENLNYPIVLYRESSAEYTALLLRCSHQYNELNVNGELLTCPAHGSEFDAKGNVVNGPADEKLRQFKTTVDNENIYIHLA